jgi:hypothetical protein
MRSHPWGLPLLIAGQFGLVSLALVAIALFAGTFRELWTRKRGLLPVIVVVAAIDASLNSYVYFPAVLAAAAMAAPFPRPRGHVAGETAATAGASIAEAQAAAAVDGL